MPSISDMLKLNGGQLGTTSLQEAQTLTGQQAPTSPMQASTIGADQDAAKMAGSSAQKVPALREAIQGQNNLNTRTREQQANTQASDTQQKEITGAQQAQQLGDLGSRVQSLAEQQLQKGVQAATAQGLSTAGIADPETRALADKLKTNPNDMDALAALGTKLGHVPTQDDILALVGGAGGIATAAGQSAAANTANNIQVSQLDPTVATTASQLLKGVDVSKMTVQQLTDAINHEIQADYTNTQNLQAKLSDPTVGAAEKAEARSQLKDMGASGVTAAESTTEKLADKIQNADTVQFNGQSLKVDNLLSSDYVAGLVSNFLTDPNSATSKTLAANEPDLVKFINDYKPVLEAAVTSLGTGIPKFAAIQQQNQALANVDLGSGQNLKLSDDVMKQLYPKWGQMTGEQFNPAASPLLQYMSNQNPSIKVTDKQGLNDALTKHPELAPVLSRLTPAQIQSGFTGDNLARFQKSLSQFDSVKQLDPTVANPESVARIYGFYGQSDMQSALQKSYGTALMHGQGQVYLNSLNQSGIAASAGVDGTLHPDFNSMQMNLINKTPTDISAVLQMVPAATQGDTAKSFANKATPADLITLNEAPDGRITSLPQLSDIANQLLHQPNPQDTVKNATDFIQSTAYKTLPNNLKQSFVNDSLQAALRSNIDAELAKAMPAAGTTGISGTSLQAAISKATPAVAATMIPSLQQEISTIKAQEAAQSTPEVRHVFSTIRQQLEQNYDTLVNGVAAANEESAAQAAEAYNAAHNQFNAPRAFSGQAGALNITPPDMRAVERTKAPGEQVVGPIDTGIIGT